MDFLKCGVNKGRLLLLFLLSSLIHIRANDTNFHSYKQKFGSRLYHLETNQQPLDLDLNDCWLADAWIDILGYIRDHVARGDSVFNNKYNWSVSVDGTNVFKC